MKQARSGCPINLSLELYGDRWTLLVLRDMIFTGARHFQQLRAGPEKISGSILSDRLEVLVARGLLTRAGDPGHKQKVVYSLTERAIELVPVLAQISTWGVRHLPVDTVSAARTGVLIDGGPPVWDAFMDELRELHLGATARRAAAPAGPSVTDRMDAAADLAAASAR